MIIVRSGWFSVHWVWKTLIAYKLCTADIWLILVVNFGSTTMKYTQNTLDKIERILDEVEYVVRYERGNFQSGYCILEARKVVVLNKFLQMEGRINTLIDLIPQLNIDPDTLSSEVRRTYEDVLARHAAAEK